MAQFDASLAQAIHDRDGPKPLTCSGLSGGRRSTGGIVLRTGEPCSVRITGLNRPTVECLLAAFGGKLPEVWTMQHIRFRVLGVVCDEAVDLWTGQTTYEKLATRFYSTATPVRHVTMEFASPTSFRSKSLNMPLPLPGLVFGSLVDRWNTFGGTLLSDEFRRFAEEMMAVSRFELQSRSVEQKNAALSMGCVGTATYVATGGDRYWHSAMEILADFAIFSGIGVKTTTGMGQSRRITEQEYR